MNWVLPGYLKDALKNASQTEVQAMAFAAISPNILLTNGKATPFQASCA